MRRLLPCLVLALAACEPADDVEAAAPVDPVVIDENEQCDAADYRSLIGTNVTEAVLTEGQMLRVYGDGDIVTQEYLPMRTNVVFDEAGTIQRVICG